MTKPWTVQCSYMSHVANTVTVEADTLEEALEKAIEAANEDPAGWKSTGHVSDSHVDAVCEGAGADPWGDGTLPVPDRFTERGEPPVVTLTGPVPPGAVEVSGGQGPGPHLNRSRHGHKRSLRPAASARATSRWSRFPSDPTGSPVSRLRAARPGFASSTEPDAGPSPPAIHPSRTRRRSARSGGRPSSGRRRPRSGSDPVLHASASSHGRPAMKLDPTPIPAAAPLAATPVAATPAGPTDEAHKRAIADAVWTDLLWLMPPDRTPSRSRSTGATSRSSSAPPEPAHVRHLPLTGGRP